MPTKSLNERAEYNRGYVEGYRLGQADTIEKLKAEIEKEIISRDSDDYDHDVMFQNCGLRIALKIIDNIGKGE